MTVDKKGLEAAKVAFTGDARLGLYPEQEAALVNAITAYLNAAYTEVEMDVVAWNHKLTTIIRYDRPNSYDIAQGDYDPLVTLSQASSIIAAKNAEIERINAKALDEVSDLILRAEAAEARNKELEEALTRISEINYGKPDTLYAHRAMIEYARDQARTALSGGR